MRNTRLKYNIQITQFISGAFHPVKKLHRFSGRSVATSAISYLNVGHLAPL